MESRKNNTEFHSTTQALESLKIAIFGLGLMGGSLAMALHGKCRELLAVDPDKETIQYAESQGIVDSVSECADDNINKADIIILATPIQTIFDLLDDLPYLHSGAPIVMDLGSTKTSIVQKMGKLPERFDPIGGHPMCGKENASIWYADHNLYRNAPFALVPLERTSEKAKYYANKIIEVVGGVAILLDPIVHDEWTAKTSHLPYLAATSLVSITPQKAAVMLGPGFKSTTRLAGSKVKMMLDILKTNRANILNGLIDLNEELSHLRALLEREDFMEIEKYLEQNKSHYLNLLE